MALSDERWLHAIRRGDKTQHRVLAESAIPPIKVGERFWLRESYCRNPDGGEGILYLADFETPFVFDGKRDSWDERNWLPPAMMPRYFSRLTLEITDVRLENLQASVENGGVLAEGLPFNNYNTTSFLSIAMSYTKRIEWFSREWDAENPVGNQWRDNPLVWVIEWKAHHENIDAQPKSARLKMGLDQQTTTSRRSRPRRKGHPNHSA